MPTVDRKPDAAPAPQNFETELPLELSDFSPHTRVLDMGSVELDDDPDYRKQDAEARGPQTNHGRVP